MTETKKFLKGDITVRNSRPEVLYEKVLLKTVVPEWFATLLKKSLWYRCFLVNFAKFLSTSFLQNASG